ncbi:Multidrug export protein MepA [Fusobacterium sp. DD29]|uniref:MATE family efflux transporter n=1 Tax=unclassified Fusobacterium TaxID=2648384 RepID=UPI001B8CC623|nr:MULTISPECIES: MATE family efflux transporter [unclassified Fusobacterium]MBR8700889.1 Multidrug export protein MepA [Fusobacterium sp. DD45]MBR8710647.1 Multidrug export protein MepA [Fusobacterium sp. DD28]MBR8748826.1 Multidrug export protein MepA [Fusobacterium sp. DD29]MBR8751239.1 Multidrug export protein MepA [Fusobacterium sp. DD26]MBR8761093.1 Multidrug export protein MepA [Fusobacterium sp. DD25]
METTNKSNFAKGSIYKHILALAVPMTIAQMVQVLYNIVDRIYIGHLPGASSLALTGLGLTFPIITIVMAITNLFGMGGAPLCSIARGQQNVKRAEEVMGNTLTMLVISSFILMFLAYTFLKPVLYLFGASDASYPYAMQYMRIYLIGTPFIVIGSGMNGFINAQGFGNIGMITILAGAIVNIILDPIFIFLLGLGIQGAAIATVISQFISVAWVMSFLLGKRTLLKITKDTLKVQFGILREILGLGMASCLMTATNGVVQVACNTMLKEFGGDVYVGLMTVVNSIRDVAMLPIHGVTAAAQPVLGYNFGAKEYDRIKKGIIFVTFITSVYMVVSWVAVLVFPEPLIKVFNSDPDMISKGISAIHIYFFGFFMMAFQISGQAVFVGLGQSKQAIFFTLFRKVFVVVPLTLLLPRLWNLGVDGIFMAEPVSNFLGGIACYTTMIFTMKKLLRDDEEITI